jgi:diguanylate cyclase (GGDEF)-like protein
MSDPGSNLPLWIAFLALAQQATRDPLTGLYNRRYFDNTLSDHIEAARRYNRPLSLVLFDLDAFKSINDAHGHQTGDKVLRNFAGLLAACARKADIVCRYGGDEFAVILPETDGHNAQVFAERVCLALAESAVSPTARVSAGISSLPCDNLVQTADADLLAKKRVR